jgi:cation diffusion facilitator CzcD-associated flavoprotein CzcO
MTVFMDSSSSGPATVDDVAPQIPPIKPTTNGNLHTQVNVASNGSLNTHNVDFDPFELSKEYAYTPHKMKVITIGAGFSGLLMAHKFQHRFPEMSEMVDHTIFESHSEVGGTWLVNDYPGVQCDVPAHIYAFPFDPNPEWTRFYASGAEILAYFKRIVKKWNLDRDLQLNTKVVGAAWQEGLGQWKVTVEHAGVQRDEFCHVLISGQGVLV